MVHTLKLGSLYLDDKPVTQEAEYCPGRAISFGEAAPDTAISWVPVNGLLIADRCLLTDISWDDLNVQNLVFGKEIKVQGFQFRSRLLKVGNAEGVPNEWDAAVDVAGENDDLWPWEDMFFWGQDSTAVDASRRAGRGYHSARGWSWSRSSNRDARLGFRPALEPLSIDSADLRPGQKILAIGRAGAVVGTLEDMTHYDLILRAEPGSPVEGASFAASLRNGTVAVDRSGVHSLLAV